MLLIIYLNLTMRKYKRKINRGSWRECDIQQAMEAVNSRKMSYRQAAKQYAVPKTTLCRKVKKSLLNLGTHNTKKNMGRFKNVLSVAQEKELKKHIKGMDDAFYGLTTRDICSLVFEFCSKNKIPHPFNQVKQSAGRDFIYNFLKRHPDISLRKPQGISINRILGCNKEDVQRYFLNLNQLLDENDFSSHQIYNCDETGITTVHKPVKVIAKKGKKSVSSATSGERGGGGGGEGGRGG